MIDTTKTITGINVNGTEMNIAGGGGGSGSNGMQTYINLRNTIDTETSGEPSGCMGLFAAMSDMTDAQLATIMSGVDTSEVEHWDGCFLGCGITATPNLDFSSAASCGSTFERCGALQTVLLDMPNVVDALRMFADCTSLESVTITNSDNLENASEMFSGCENLQSVVIDANAVTNTSDMFFGCVSFNTLILNGLRVDLDISDITADSGCLVSLLNSLGDVASDGNPATGAYSATLTMGQGNIDALNTDYPDAISDAEAKGWTIN